MGFLTSLLNREKPKAAQPTEIFVIPFTRETVPAFQLAFKPETSVFTPDLFSAFIQAGQFLTPICRPGQNTPATTTTPDGLLVQAWQVAKNNTPINLDSSVTLLLQSHSLDKDGNISNLYPHQLWVDSGNTTPVGFALLFGMSCCGDDHSMNAVIAMKGKDGSWRQPKILPSRAGQQSKIMTANGETTVGRLLQPASVIITPDNFRVSLKHLWDHLRADMSHQCGADILPTQEMAQNASLSL